MLAKLLNVFDVLDECVRRLRRTVLFAEGVVGEDLPAKLLGLFPELQPRLDLFRKVLCPAFALYLGSFLFTRQPLTDFDVTATSDGSIKKFIGINPADIDGAVRFTKKNETVA